MTRKLLRAFLIGGLVGAVCGLIESVAWVVVSPAWQVETFGAAVAMVAIGAAVYGLLTGLITLLWGLAAGWMEEQPFRIRTWLFAILPMGYLLGGFYANHLWFPQVSALPSLVFTGLWTLGWLAGVLALLRFRVKPVPMVVLGGGRRDTRPWQAALGVLVVAGLALVIVPRLSMERPPITSGQVASASPERPNVLLIVMDTTRADHLSCYGYHRRTSPNLDRLAQEGVLFEQALSAAPWTLPSHASLFTGLYPSQHGADWLHMRLDDHHTTLAELLQRHGYQTAGFSNNPWVNSAANFHQGFTHFENFQGTLWPWPSWWAVNRLALFRVALKMEQRFLYGGDGGAARTHQRITRWFDTTYDPHRPFFLFINYMEPHFPYEPLEPYRSRFLRYSDQQVAEALKRYLAYRTQAPERIDATSEAVLADLYDGEIAYLDAKIGELMDALKARQLFDQTIVIVTADHGEHLGERHLFGHQHSVYEPLLHVPLILRDPQRLPSGVRVQEPVSLVDVVPTLLTVLGLEEPDLRARLPGQSWVAGSALMIPRERLLVAEYLHRPLSQAENAQPVGRAFTNDLTSLRTGLLKFIAASDGSRQFYDLATDPGESENLMMTRQQQASALETTLQQQLLRLTPLGTPEQVPTMDAATRSRLRALGYLQ